MTFEGRPFVIVAGLHSKRFAAKLEEILLPQPGMHFGSGRMLVRSLKTGDVDAKASTLFAGEDVFLVQQMERDPWQDLAALCVAAQEAKRCGAGTVTGIVPVWKLGRYADNGSSTSGQLTAGMLAGSGMDRLVTLAPALDMLSAWYPVRVIVPGYGAILEDAVRQYIGKSAAPLILAVNTESLAEAQRLQAMLGWDIGPAMEYKTGWQIGADTAGREILLVAAHVSSSLADLAERLEASGSEGIACYIPCIEDPDKRDWKDNRAIRVILTPDEIPACSSMAPHVQTLPTEQRLAEWIFADRQEPHSMDLEFPEGI